MAEAVIVDAIRTPMGKRNGKLSGFHPADLAGEVLKALSERNDLDPALVEDVIMGCVMQVGAQGVNIGRNAVLAAGWPESVPATTIDRQCGSSQQSAHFAAQGVMAGAYDVVVAAGVEVMSMVPMGASIMAPNTGVPFGPRMMAALRRPGRPRPPGHLGRAHRREVGPLPRGPRRLRRPQPAVRGQGPRGGPLRAGDPPGPGHARSTRRPASSSRPTRSCPRTRASARTPPSRRSPT